MRLAKWSARLCEKTLSFKILLASRTVETLGVIILVHCLHPPISSLNGESTSVAFRCKQLIPISITVCQPIFQEEGRVTEWLVTMAALEALGVEALSDGGQTLILDPVLAPTTGRGDITFPTELTVESPLLLDKAHVNQGTGAVGRCTLEVVRTVKLGACCYEGATNLLLARVTNSNPWSRLGKNTLPPCGEN
jgi:hypothetical protein